MGMRWLAIGLGVVVACASAGPARGGADRPRQLQAITAMTPLQMAKTSRQVVRAYTLVVERARRIASAPLRDAVLNMIDNPAPTCLGVPALTAESFLAAAGGGWAGHHAYPGGLAVHTAANMLHALHILETYKELYGARFDEDLVVGAVIMHDVLKSYTNQFHPRWDRQNGKFYAPPEVQPKGEFHAWGVFGLMGHHNEMVVTELMYRDAPPELVFAAHSHQDQYWDARANAWLKQSDETWERTLDEAIAKLDKIPQQVKKAQRYRQAAADPRVFNIETGINVLADKDWNITQGKAQPAATRVFEAYAAQIPNLAADSKDYNMARNWLFSRVDPIAIAAVLQREGMDGAVKFLAGVFRDPKPYEVDG